MLYKCVIIFLILNKMPFIDNALLFSLSTKAIFLLIETKILNLWIPCSIVKIDLIIIIFWLLYSLFVKNFENNFTQRKLKIIWFLVLLISLFFIIS